MLSKGDTCSADDKYILKPIPSGHGRVTKFAIALSLLTVASLIVRESWNFQEVMHNSGDVDGFNNTAMKDKKQISDCSITITWRIPVLKMEKVC